MEHKYDRNYQKQLLTLLLSSNDVFARVRPIVRTEYFEPKLAKSVEFILDYVDKFNRIPLPEEISMKTGEEFSLIDKSLIPEDSTLEETETFCRYRAIENVIIDGTDLLEKQQHGEIETRLKDAMTISLINDLGSEFFSDVQLRRERLKNRDNVVPTGWDVIDKKLYGGFTIGSLNIFAGGSGSGKSLFLQNACLNWSYMGKHVIYITLELSEDLVGNRMDSMVSGMATKDIFRNSDEMFYRFNKQIQQNKPGSLHIKKMPEAGTTCNDIRAYMREYQIKYGRKPDVLVVDYLDLLHPNNSRIDVTNAFHKDKYVSEEMRSIGGDFGIPVLTASQLNRQSVEAMEFDHSHIAGGISKINTADNVFGIFTSHTMRENGEYQIQFLKTRSSGAVGQKIKLAYDPNCMRISDPIDDDDDDDDSGTTITPSPTPSPTHTTPPPPSQQTPPFNNGGKKAQLDDLLKQIRK